MWNKWLNSVLAIVIIVVAVWPTMIGATASMWTIVAAAVIMLIAEWMGKCNCAAPAMSGGAMPKAAVSKVAPKAAKKKK